MKNLLKSALGAAALLAISMSGTAQAEPDYPFAATGHVAGGAGLLEQSRIPARGPVQDRDLAYIVAGGDFVIPVNGYWNLQMGGALYYEHIHFPFGGTASNTQFQGSTIGFWRNPDTGVFGIEAGLQSFDTLLPIEYVKVGAVAEYFFNDMVTLGAFGGALIPTDERPFGPNGTRYNTGFYAGGHATWYASSNFAFSGFARFVEVDNEFNQGINTFTLNNLEAGGKVRYLTPMSGIEVYASAAYTQCDQIFAFGQGSNTTRYDGAKIMAGVQVRLGGHTDSLVSIDRSNALDTDAWLCDQGVR